MEEEAEVIANSFKISPNPTADNVFISYAGQARTDFELNIIDISGRSIMRTQFRKEVKLDISTLQSGIYFIQFLHEGKLKKIYKLSKSR